MKATKIILMAALALMTVACSNDDNDIQTPAEQPAKAEGIPFTATISMGESASTRALAEDTENKKIVATWADNEEVALIYDAGGTPTKTDAKVTKQTDGTATISATLETGATNGSDVTIIYPATAADGTTGKVLANLLTAQDGTLATIATNYDVRKGTGKLSISGGKATVNNGTAGTTVALTNQFAIWKLTLNNDAKNLCIMADNITIAGATLGTADKEFTVAVPAVSSKKVTIVANDESNNCYYYSEAGVSLYAGKYYQSKPTMTALDEDNSKPLYKITGNDSAIIPDDKTVVLSGVNISRGSITCLEHGSVTMILLGDNKVTAAANNAAIRVVGTGTALTITGTGSLTATGGDNGAGIGTNGADDTTLSGGNIVINGGRVNATGGADAAGIGTGMANSSSSGNASQTCGTITINGGTVTATGGVDAAGIGTGSSLGNGTQTCGDITINGGTVTVTAIGAGGAGIGTGYVDRGSNTCGAITIGTGVTSVIATKGLGCPNSIGPGYASTLHTQHCGKITFGTKQVFDGTDWSSLMKAGTYGGLNLAISTTTNTDDTWTLTPAP